jgi:hypothetical protein
MSYEAQAKLESDFGFQQRNRSVLVEQAQFFLNLPEQGPDSIAMANAILRNMTGWDNFVQLAAAGPGIADKATMPNGEIDSSLVTDADLLSLTQANWPLVTSLFFTEDGTPI